MVNGEWRVRGGRLVSDEVEELVVRHNALSRKLVGP
jgi:hypothetical protein